MGDSLAQRHAAALKLLEDLTSSLNDVEPLGDISRAQADYNAAEERHSREQDPTRKRALCRELVRYGDRLEEIQKQHQEAETKRKEQLDLFDSRLSKEGYQKLASRATFNTSTDQTTHQTSEAPESPFQTPEIDSIQPPSLSNDRATHHTTGSPGNLPQTNAIRNTIEPRSTPSRTHSATPSRGFSTDIEQQVGAEPTGPTGRSNKRRDNLFTSRPAKHQRQSASSDIVTERTICFDEVYQGGEARWKYRIVKINGLYYIFGCEKHEKHFRKENPLQSAMSHLKGKGHSVKRPNATQALKSLGTQVLQCSDALLQLNNDAANRYLAEQEEKRKRREASIRNLTQAPQTGEIYMAWFGDDDVGHCLHAFLVMPFFPRPGDDPEMQSVTESDLKVNIPACYKLNKTSIRYDWAEGYEEHGKYAGNRVYPIMCLVGEIPHKVDWLPVCHFRNLDLNDKDLEDKDIVKAYISRNSASKSSFIEICFFFLLIELNEGHGNEIEDESEDLYGDSLAGDDDAPTSSGHRQIPIGRASENVNTDQTFHLGATAENQESRSPGPNLPTQEAKDEPTTIARGDEAARHERQPSVRQRWPSARKGPPLMETLDDSDSE
ncbi:hypothetical protein FNYG_14117 [Fusarium nygamai]|uniref:Uncharacterized protein n=1 Tax=Gibberella nygamai TaxID=42673 RepID=A0A2K0UTC9_GIBNY|nr:hypothetical protein FNYG_14117 [Fusarium nygamai]